MSVSDLFDQGTLRRALGEIEVIHRKLPPAAVRTLALEVVERLAARLPPAIAPENLPSTADIDRLCDALLSEDPMAATAIIAAARRDGARFETLCLSHLAVAARRLGDRWDADLVSFMDVTLAMGRIYAILRGLRRDMPHVRTDARRVADFASVPGEDHTLGIAMAANLCRDRGWDIALHTGLAHGPLVDVLAASRSRLIGLSAGSAQSLPALMRLIVALRISNPGAAILICGQIAALDINLIGVSGADAAASDIETALVEMNRLLGLTTAS